MLKAEIKNITLITDGKNREILSSINFTDYEKTLLLGDTEKDSKFNNSSFTVSYFYFRACKISTG